MGLLDELEKASASMRDRSLQVFDDGWLTDARGRTADTSTSIFVVTSNRVAAEGGVRAA